MAPKTQDPDEVLDHSRAVLAGAIDIGENRSAYFLARNIHLIDGWLFAVRRLAETGDGEFQWTFPNTLLAYSCDVPPLHLFAGVDGALRDLAIAGRLDAAVLVELHRSLDAAAESCVRLAELVAEEAREEIRAGYWALGCDIHDAICLLPRVLRSEVDLVSVWFGLGNHVGRLLGDNGFPGYAERFCSAINEIVETSARACATKLARSPILDQDPSKISFNAFKGFAELFDNDLIRSLRGDTPNDVWLTLNDKRRILTYLGVDLPYDAFGTTIDVVRVMVQHAKAPLSASEIADKSGRGIDAGQVGVYFSRFRSTVRETRNRWPKDFQHDRLAGGVFIVVDPIARKRAHSNDTWYKLDLPAHRLLHIPAVQPT